MLLAHSSVYRTPTNIGQWSTPGWLTVGKHGVVGLRSGLSSELDLLLPLFGIRIKTMKDMVLLKYINFQRYILRCPATSLISTSRFSITPSWCRNPVACSELSM